MKALCIFLLFIICCAVAFGNWVFSSYSLQKTQVGDEYLLLEPEQAKECREGGGCAVWSQREFANAVARLLIQRERT